MWTTIRLTRPVLMRAIDEPFDTGELAADDPARDIPPAAARTDTGPPHIDVAGLWSTADAQAIRDRWREVQLRFVDDPRAAADEAAELVDDAARLLVTAIESHRGKLGGWRDSPSGDTEELRLVVQRYREFVDRVLGV